MENKTSDLVYRVPSVLNLAVIWGHHRDDADFTTHHTFWMRTLADNQRVKVTRYIWPEMMDMKNDHDLYFFIDFDPRLYRLPEDKFRPRILYTWDSFHTPFTYPAQLADMFDRSYWAEKQIFLTLQRQGFTRARWLPPSYYEGCYHPLDIKEKVHHISFVGQPDDVVVRKGVTRKEIIERLIRSVGLRGFVGQGVYGAAVNKIYNETLVCVDRRIFNNIGTRFFETIGSGAFLLINRARVDDGMDDLGTDGMHFITYDDSYEDLERKVRYYIEHDEEREKIAEKGHKHFYNNHRYVHRWNTILADLGIQ